MLLPEGKSCLNGYFNEENHDTSHEISEVAYF